MASQASPVRVRRELSRCAARPGARPAARGRVLGGLSRRGRRVQGEAQAAVQRQVKTFPLEPIEKAPRAELERLQLERLQWSLQHAYDNVPHYRKKFDAAGVKPGDCRSLEDLARFPSPPRPTCATPIRSACSPCRWTASCASMLRPAPPASRPWSATPRRTSTPGRTLMARSIRAAGARPGDKVHVAYGYGLFTGGLGAHYGAERLGLAVIPLGGGMTERQVQLIADFKPDIIMVTPSYMLAIADEMERQGVDPKKTLAAHRHLRRRAVDQRDAPVDRAARRPAGDRPLRPVRGDRARAWRRSAPRPRTASRSGRTTSIPRSSTRRAASRCPRARRASWCSPRSPRKRCR